MRLESRLKQNLGHLAGQNLRPEQRLDGLLEAARVEDEEQNDVNDTVLSRQLHRLTITTHWPCIYFTYRVAMLRNSRS